MMVSVVELVVDDRTPASISLNKVAILSRSSSLIDIELVGVDEWRPPRLKFTVLLVVISADMESIYVLNPHFVYFTW